MSSGCDAAKRGERNPAAGLFGVANMELQNMNPTHGRPILHVKEHDQTTKSKTYPECRVIVIDQTFEGTFYKTLCGTWYNEVNRQM